MTDRPTLLELVTDATGDHAAPPPTGHPEALLISALLESGTYNPRVWGVPPSAFHALAPVHRFCQDYQDTASLAPPVHLVTARFPSFVFTPGIAPAWAAHEVTQADTNRTLRKGIAAALHAIGDEAYGEAIGTLRETVAQVVTANRPGTLVTDFSGTRAAADKARCPIPPGRLAALTGGHGAGQLWLVAALWGVGKTFKLVDHAVAAAEAGWDVVFFSLEMTVEDILARVRAAALHHLGHHALATGLDQIEALIGQWAQGTGHLEVRGPDAGRLDISVISGAVAHPRTLVLIDYVGKMVASDGRPAATGHEVAALVSKELAMQAGALNVPVLGAAQLNRLGQVAGTISLEQDADLILEQRRVSPKVNGIRQNILVKSRHTALIPTWFTRFDPVTPDFRDLDGAEAQDIRIAEESSVWS